MSILIEKVRIQNYRSLKNIEVELKPLTLLAGMNNAGKTSFLKALNLALGVEKRSITRQDLFIDKDGQLLKDTEGGDLNTLTIDVKIVSIGSDGDRIERFNDDGIDDWLGEFGTDIKTEATGSDFFAFRFQATFDAIKDEPEQKWWLIEDWDNPPNEDDRKEITARLYKLPLYFIDAQRDIQDDIRNQTSYFGKLMRQIVYDKAVLEDLEKELEKINNEAVDNSDVLKHLRTTLKELNETVSAGSKGVEITPFPKKVRDLHKGVKLHFQDSESDVFEMDYHGVGTRSWSSLLAFKAYVSWEYSSKNKSKTKKVPFYPILALEEPESHLHPNAQRHLYRQLKETRGQKIISTHSPYILGQAALDEIRLFRKTSDETTVSQINTTDLTPEEQRKIRREILHSRGELLFAKAVILSEGETEEQALPIFAENYFGREVFELGINFVGCGGNNYKSFLHVLNSLGINWFVFSDYDNASIQTGVEKQLAEIGITDVLNEPRVIILGQGIENYLITEGYQTELKKAILEHHEPFGNHHFRAAKERDIARWSDIDIKKYLNAWKTKIAPLYAEIIANLTDENRRIPVKIKTLFDEINKKLKIIPIAETTIAADDSIEIES